MSLYSQTLAAEFAESLGICPRHKKTIQKILSDNEENGEISTEIIQLFCALDNKVSQLKKLEKVHKLVLEAANL